MASLTCAQAAVPPALALPPTQGKTQAAVPSLDRPSQGAARQGHGGDEAEGGLELTLINRLLRQPQSLPITTFVNTKQSKA